MKGVGWMKKNISDDVEKILEALEEESDLSSDESGEDIQDPKINLEENEESKSLNNEERTF